jgi:hypothetical protein
MIIKKDTIISSNVSDLKENTKSKNIDKTSKTLKTISETTINLNKVSVQQKPERVKMNSIKEKEISTSNKNNKPNSPKIKTDSNLQKKDKPLNKVKEKNLSQQVISESKKINQSKNEVIKPNSKVENKDNKTSSKKRDIIKDKDNKEAQFSMKDKVVQKEPFNLNKKNQPQKVHDRKTHKFDNNKHSKNKKEGKKLNSPNYKGPNLREHSQYERGMKHVTEFKKYLSKNKVKFPKRPDVFCTSLKEIIFKFPEAKDLSKSFIVNENGDLRLKTKDGSLYDVTFTDNLLKLKYFDEKAAIAKAEAKALQKALLKQKINDTLNSGSVLSENLKGESFLNRKRNNTVVTKKIVSDLKNSKEKDAKSSKKNKTV